MHVDSFDINVFDTRVAYAKNFLELEAFAQPHVSAASFLVKDECKTIAAFSAKGCFEEKSLHSLPSFKTSGIGVKRTVDEEEPAEGRHHPCMHADPFGDCHARITGAPSDIL